MKKIKLNFLTLFFLLLCSSIFAQDIEGMLKLAYPELYGDYKIDETSVYAPAAKNKYREIYKKLEEGFNEAKTTELGGSTSENVFIFTYKDLEKLRKDERLQELKDAITKHERAISKLMFGKEQYGADSVKAVRTISLFQEYTKQNNYAEAYNAWTVLFNEFPMASKNIYILGTNVLYPKIEAAATPEEKELWIDTLMMMYDQRIQFFDEGGKYGKGFVLGRKGTDLLKYRTNTHNEEAYKILLESIELQGVESEVSVVLTAMKATYAVIAYKKIECAEVVENYIKFSDIISQQSKKETDDKKIATLKTATEGVDQFFIKTGCATCEKLEEAFEPRFNEKPNDIELIKKILEIFTSQKCETSALYEKAAEALYPIEPSEIAAFSLAQIKAKGEKFDEAVEYYEKAIEFCTDDSLKANYYYRAGVSANSAKKYNKAISLSKSAINANPNYGEPYMLLALSYAAIAGGCGDSFEQSAVNWVVVDKLLIAKIKDPTLAEKVNQLINNYSGRYPDKNECFFRTIYEGQSYNVNCLGEATTVRF